MKKIFLFVIASPIMSSAFGQTGYVGIGTTSPGTTLDVAGAVTTRQTTITFGSSTPRNVALPANTSFVRLAGTPVWQTVMLTAPTAVTGQHLTILNDLPAGSYATLDGTTIVANQALQFVYTNNKYRPVNNIATVNGSIIVDANGSNAGTDTAYVLKFGGPTSGEAIGSRRIAGNTQNGLDFYTNGGAVMSINNGGDLLLGTSSRVEKLTVAGGIYASGNIALGGNLKVEVNPYNFNSGNVEVQGDVDVRGMVKQNTYEYNFGNVGVGTASSWDWTHPGINYPVLMMTAERTSGSGYALHCYYQHISATQTRIIVANSSPFNGAGIKAHWIIVDY